MQFTIPDDFSQAEKIEIYLDLWRNRIPPSARFSLNNGPIHTPDVGTSWSRTPWIGEIPASELQQGVNEITLWDESGGYHIHDIGFRIYHNDTAPLLPGPGSDVTPPTGQLTSIIAANGTFAPGDGGTLDVDTNQITFTASAEGASYVEFHAFYDGYDEDNDQQFVDWHNLGRNNRNPGPNGTINHIGTATIAPYRATWQLPHVVEQPGVKFKARIVDGAGNVREAAGGVSAAFTLSRTHPSASFRIPHFQDAVLHHDGSQPLSVDRTINLPGNLGNFNTAYLVGAYWNNPFISINGNSAFAAFAPGEDTWALSIRKIPFSALKPGANQITYSHNSGFGEFIERPGPMLVLKQVPPAFSVSPGEMHFFRQQGGANPNPQIFTIENTGGGDIHWTTSIQNGSAWLQVTPPTGANDGAVTVSVDAAGLALGTYTDVLLVSAAETASTQQIPVTLEIGSEPAVFYQNDFNAGAPGSDPAGWVDTDANNSMATNDALFGVHEVGVDSVLGTSSTQTNIHSHYVAAESANWTAYRYSGRMRMSAGDSGIGVTVLSDYPQSDRYYRLRRYGNGSFHLSPHGTGMTGGSTDTGVVPVANTWYHFKVQVESSESQTRVRAKVWPQGSGEPAAWQADAYDSSASQRTVGRVGVWSHGTGSKYWDDLTVTPLAEPENGPFTLTVNSAGGGSVSVDPAQAEYSAGQSVTLTAVPDEGQVFTGWGGDVNSTNNPLTLSMDSDTVVTASFAPMSTHTLTVSTAGTGTVTIDPQQTEYSTGDAVTLTAVAGTGALFSGWQGDASGSANPLTLLIDSDRMITATFSSIGADLYSENFSSYAPGSDPAGWVDTDANNSMATNDALFGVHEVGIDSVLGTSSTQTNIHSHYVAAESANWTAYRYSGRMRMSAGDSGVGVTVLSDYPQSDRYYRLRRYGNGSFHLSPHGTGMTGGSTDTGVVPVANTWYHFKVEVESTGGQTRVRAKVWPQGSGEPAAWQADAYDSSASRRTVGRVGVWSHGTGSKYWDDLTVTPLAEPENGPFTLTVNSAGGGSVSVDPAQAEYSAGQSVTLTAVPDEGQLFTGWSGDATGADNPLTLSMDSDKVVTASFEAVPTHLLNITTSGNGTVQTSPSGSTHPEGTVVTLTAEPEPGWRFDGWSGDLTGSENPASITMNSDRAISAAFVQEPPVTLSVNTVGAGTVALDPELAQYPYGSSVSLTATAAEGWAFSAWVGDVRSGEWWDDAWRYRASIQVAANGQARLDKPVDVAINFTNLLSGLGEANALDADSLRVVEVSGTGQVLDGNVPFQFDPAADFDALNNAAGTLVLVMQGATAADAQRTYHVYFDTDGNFSPPAISPQVTLTDNVMDEGQSSVQIETANAVYYYHKQGGGFSSLVDSNGNDWINHHPTGGSAGNYRGIPNLIYPGPGFHPGTTSATTSVIHQGPIKATIHSVTTDNAWEVLWEIYPQYARMTLLKAGHEYWFLYEGTPGGVLEPSSDIVVRSDGTQTTAATSWTGDLGGEEWVYFGDPGIGRSLYLSQHESDSVVDSYYPMDGRMTVFGFGRQGINRYLTQVPARYTIGLMDETAFAPSAQVVRSAYTDVSINLHEAESRDATGTAVVNPLTLSMTENKVVTATFSTVATHTVTIDVVGNGTVVVDPPQTVFLAGDVITLTATADAGSVFSGWSGDASGVDNPLVLMVDSDKAITATFVPAETSYTLSVHTVGDGTVAIDPNLATYSPGQSVTLTAVAANGYSFSEWSGDWSGSVSPATFAMDANKVITATFDADATGTNPVIDLWYGPNQRFGHLGNPQQWVNILGNASDADGIASLVYSVNGGPELALNMGPDDRRLLEAGDFVIEIDYANLLSGANQVQIRATDTLNNETIETVNVTYQAGQSWPMPYVVDWSSVTDLQDVAQVVDGQWTLEPSTLRPVVTGYDRLVAIGDTSWTDYEVVVPITIHGVDPYGFQGYSGGHAVGFVLGWQGHDGNSQPRWGYSRHGAIAWYHWNNKNNFNTFRLRTQGNVNVLSDNTALENVSYGATYYLKARVESNPGDSNIYRLKAWKISQPEPANWSIVSEGNASSTTSGSILLVSHHVDASFGTVIVTPLNPITPTLSVATVGNGTVEVDPEQTEYSMGQTVSLTATASPEHAFVGWSGDLNGNENPTTITMNASKAITATFAEIATYTLNVTTVGTGTVSVDPLQSEYTTGDLVTLTAVAGEGTVFTGWNGDLGGTENPTTVVMDGNKNITASFDTAPGDPSGIDSDDFSGCTLDTAVWSFVDPLGDGALQLTGTQAQISVPGGTAHDVWSGGAMAPRLMQAAANTDFTLEVKFESAVSERFEMQGLLVEQDASNFLRFDFYGDNGPTRLFAAQIVNGTPTVRYNSPVPGGAPLYMRIERVGNTWTQSYSGDGQSWTVGAQFNHALTVGGVGVFAGNAGAAPAHTAVVDYFFNGASPIEPEDGAASSHALTVNTVGVGSVAIDPQQASYSCGQAVTLTATAESGHLFSGWSGDASGTTNPLTVTMDSSKNITATFTATEPTTYTLAVNSVGNGAVAVDPEQASYAPGESVLLTATAHAGHVFSGWSGDATGAANPLTVNMDGNKSITATFSTTQQTSYTLTVDVVGNGAVNVTPQQASYLAGEQVTLTAVSDAGYVFSGWSGDASGTSNPLTVVMDGNKNITASFDTAPGDPSGIDSDDFSGCTLDTSVWSFVDPLGDGALQLTGTQAQISVPGGTAHDVWSGGAMAPRLMQAAANTDFTLEVKFESAVSERFEMQGLLVEQDASNFLRFDFYGDNGPTRLFAAQIVNGMPTVRYNSPVPGGAPLYMRIERVGNTWTQSYSGDGQSWTMGAQFTHALAVSGVGVFAGNAGAAPAHTAVVDYFFNGASPIEPEDGAASSHALTVNTVGVGSVAIDPQQASYSCGQAVTLTATAESGHLFSGWSGDATGTTNPLTVTMDSSKNITATFTSTEASGSSLQPSEPNPRLQKKIFLPFVRAGEMSAHSTGHALQIETAGDGLVAVEPQASFYRTGEQVTLTALPASGYVFSGWSGDASGSSNPLVLSMDGDTAITATFKKERPSLLERIQQRDVDVERKMLLPRRTE